MIVRPNKVFQIKFRTVKHWAALSWNSSLNQLQPINLEIREGLKTKPEKFQEGNKWSKKIIYASSLKRPVCRNSHESFQSLAVLFFFFNPTQNCGKCFSLCKVCVHSQCTEIGGFLPGDPQGDAQHSEVCSWLLEPVRVDMWKTCTLAQQDWTSTV